MVWLFGFYKSTIYFLGISSTLGIWNGKAEWPWEKYFFNITMHVSETVQWEEEHGQLFELKKIHRESAECDF